MNETDIIYKGKPLSELSRAELVEAILHLIDHNHSLLASNQRAYELRRQALKRESKQ